MEKYDYLIVGAGLFGAVFAHEAKRVGKHCLVIDKRNHRGGNIYCEDIEGIHVHKYGVGLCKQLCRIQPIHQLPFGLL